MKGAKEWISVKEQPLPEDQDCLVAMPVDEECTEYEILCLWDSACCKTQVTHWMPLPESPK